MKQGLTAADLSVRAICGRHSSSSRSSIETRVDPVCLAQEVRVAQAHVIWRCVYPKLGPSSRQRPIGLPGRDIDFNHMSESATQPTSPDDQPTK